MKFTSFLPALLLLSAAQAGASGPVNHDINAELSPTTGDIKALDKLTFAKPAKEFYFTLHKGLSPSVAGAAMEELQDKAAARHGINFSGNAPESAYRITFKKPASGFTISYAGRIQHAPDAQAQEYARSFSETPGTISPEGCYLSGASGWYPYFEGEMVTFRLKTSLPAPYDTVSGGDRQEHAAKGGRNITVWESDSPQDEITLTCGKYSEYERSAGKKKYYAFLREPDAPLAESYLEATDKYIGLYSGLIAPYPYGKFALVENFWDTGYGLPSFTLLGPKVIRLPFIINSSYPHEILHNWWGNGVFVDYKSGNWCEGLTVYLADYLIAENHGKGRDYRRTALQKYSDYVSGGADFPLTEFRSRHSSAQEAVGYGKSMMMYHMLRGLLGDAGFIKGLKRFYADNLFKTASFRHMRAAFETVTGPGRLEPFFDQWVKRTGAPVLELKEARVLPVLDGYDLEFTLTQTQEGPAYSLQVPAYIYLPGLAEPRIKILPMSKKEETFHYSSPLIPARLEIDPEFDLFRRLSPLETPPTLSRLLGASKPAIIVPAGVAGKPWRGLADAWTRDKANLPEVSADSRLSGLPDSSSYWLFGGENKFSEEFKKDLGRFGASFPEDYAIIDNRRFPLAGHTFVLASFNPAAPAYSGALVFSDNTEKLPLLAAKLPHYGKYSWLVFDEGMNAVATGIWNVSSSPLAAEIPGEPVPAAKNYPARAPLAVLPSVFSAQRMLADVKRLASLPGGRAPGSKGHRKAADFIASEFGKAGLKPFPGDSFKAESGPGGSNITGAIRGLSKPAQYVVLSAHYDHLPKKDGAVYPGADDNASGIALLLELARLYAKRPPARTLIFAAFDREEEGRLGSKAFLASLPGLVRNKINAELNLDTVGRLGTGKILAIGSGSSDKWVHILRGAGFVTGHDYASAGDLDSSDQVSFIEDGIPALQFFSGANSDYHKPTDTPDKIDARGMVKIGEFVREITDYLAGDSDFLTRPSGKPAPGAPGAERKVSTGLVPDFAFGGAGVRAQDITPGSPLDKAGVKPGDVIIKFGGVPTDDLRSYSEQLKRFSPGQEAELTYLSAGAENTVRIKLAGR